VSPGTTWSEFDLFVSYAHADDRGEHAQKVTALVEAIEADYQRFAGAPLRVFFDTEEIRTMDVWEHRILRGLRHSKMMVAVLSPAYFASDYCRKEWEIYVETELAQALPGDGIAPIYVVTHPAFDGQAGSVADRLARWIKDLKRRQYIEWRPFWPEGAKALERQDVRRRLDALPAQIAERLKRAAARDASPNTVPLPSVHFVGRRREMHELRQALMDSHIGAITAVHGIPGIGKSMLAFAYAWGYGFEYPGGRFLIPGSNLAELAAGVIALAEPKGVALGDAERRQPEIALAKVKRAFETGPPALLVIDNLDDPRLLNAQARERALPKGDHIHVLVTTRVSPQDLPRIRCLPLDALEPQDALALLMDFRPIADSPQDDEWKAAMEVVHRLGGHALAMEVVAVFLRENPEVSYRTFAKSLEDQGITIMVTKVADDAKGRLAWHEETHIARLLEPTLRSLSPPERRAVELAAYLPPDTVPLPWLRELLIADFPELGPGQLGDPVNDVLRRLERLRLVVPLERKRDSSRAVAGWSAPALARMHRLVQDVVRAGLEAEGNMIPAQKILLHGQDRALRIRGEEDQSNLTWEAAPLRDMAARLIDEQDRYGYSIFFASADAQADGTPAILPLSEMNLRMVVKGEPGYQRISHGSVSLLLAARLLDVKQGDAAKAMGDLATARRHYEDALAVAKMLSDDAPENVRYAHDLAVSYEQLGDLAVAMRDAAARRYFEEALAIMRRLAEGAPQNADYAHQLSVSYGRLGNALRAMGDAAAARRYFEEALVIAERLVDAAPENADYARWLWLSYTTMAVLPEPKTNHPGARSWWGRVYDLLMGIGALRTGRRSDLVPGQIWRRRAYDVLSGMKRRGLFVSPEDEDFLRQLEMILGLDGGAPNERSRSV
jgi:tetratricopeptide (TPR) repeat protein